MSKSKGRGAQNKRARPASKRSPREQPDSPRADSAPESPGHWLYGSHAALAALGNPVRRVHEVKLTAGFRQRHDPALAAALDRRRDQPPLHMADRDAIAAMLPPEAAHQGIAVRLDPLPGLSVSNLVARLDGAPRALVVMLDQVTDPRNVGAVMRSALAFAANALILQTRHAPPETGALAKAASGALETLPLVRATNLSRAVEALQKADFHCVGLAAEADRALADSGLTGRVALVLGAEGRGLRRMVAAHCDILARLPTHDPVADLNIANAAAVALYEVARQREAGAVQ